MPTRRLGSLLHVKKTKPKKVRRPRGTNWQVGADNDADRVGVRNARSAKPRLRRS